MPCYSPMRAWRTNEINPETGKRGITFSRTKAILDMEISLPCGKCMGCRIKKSTDWALRCVHEASLHEHNCFLTLTYDDDHVPSNGSLVKKHFQNFMKRFRDRIQPIKVRYYMCGEYGDQFGRPHYHALIFGYDFPDKQPFKKTVKSTLYTSDLLQELWPYGFTTVGALTYQTAAYTAKYATKKVLGKEAAAYYGDREPEYSTMSLKPAIGADWFDKYQNELFQHDSIVHNGRSFGLPRYYTERFSEEQKLEIKTARHKEMEKHLADNTLARLRVKETVKHSKLRYYKGL